MSLHPSRETMLPGQELAFQPGSLFAFSSRMNLMCVLCPVQGSKAKNLQERLQAFQIDPLTKSLVPMTIVWEFGCHRGLGTCFPRTMALTGAEPDALLVPDEKGNAVLDIRFRVHDNTLTFTDFCALPDPVTGASKHWAVVADKECIQVMHSKGVSVIDTGTRHLLRVVSDCTDLEPRPEAEKDPEFALVVHTAGSTITPYFHPDYCARETMSTHRLAWIQAAVTAQRLWGNKWEPGTKLSTTPKAT
jgi:hypothetical protein